MWNVNDPTAPSYAGLLNKDSLGVTEFNVVKVAADADKLFISTFDSKLYKITELDPATPTYQWKEYATKGRVFDFSVQHTDIIPTLAGTTMVGMIVENDMMYFIDWYNDDSPFVLGEY